MEKQEVEAFRKQAEKIISDNTEFEIKQRKFRNKITGEIVTQIPILEIANFEEVKE